MVKQKSAINKILTILFNFKFYSKKSKLRFSITLLFN